MEPAFDFTADGAAHAGPAAEVLAARLAW